MAKEPEVAEAVVRACGLLRAFRPDDVTLTLGQLVQRTGLSKTTCFRLLQSLVKGGMVERVEAGVGAADSPRETLTIHSMTPTSGPAGTRVTITGSHFVPSCRAVQMATSRWPSRVPPNQAATRPPFVDSIVAA